MKHIHWLLITLLLSIITGCFVHRNMLYTPDIVLKDSGQPCISIPSKEDFFKKNKKFNIVETEIVQTGVGQLSLKYYHDLSKPYYVKTQECIYFDYHFQNNITYSIGFASTEIEDAENKPWVRYMRIKKNKDGTLQLLLDEHARDVTQ
jgi:protein associated with RNAse G/E